MPRKLVGSKLDIFTSFIGFPGSIVIAKNTGKNSLCLNLETCN